ncbi:MAG TPA: polysaccharide biosynthesis C-terminal domain-containing protein, partial [Candidatus Thermoplasmatota archaeon]|nr:polysaccharide biosynthesis C-terminal domain-containing protein [Candidatus Thermoplasmatota archaeon]
VLAVKYLTPRDASDAMVAHYQSASVLAKAHLWVVIAAIGVAFPVISRAATQEGDGAARLASRLLRWTVVGLLPVVAFLAAFSERALLLVFPPDYASSAPALSLSALAMGALAVCFVLARALQATGRAAAPGMGLAVTAALQAALLVVLVPRHGIVGAAAATLAACVVGLSAAAAVACRAFGFRVRVRRVAAAALATGAFLLVVWAFPDGRFATVAALASGCLVYGGLAWATGLLTPDERALLLARVPWLRPQEEPL